MFRVEADIGLTTEHTYTFSIDGVKFVDMPRKPLAGSKGKTTPKSEPFGAEGRRASAGGDKPSTSNNAPRGNFQSPFAPSNNRGSVSGGGADPFSSGGDSFDPFGDDDGFKPSKSGSATKAQKSTPPAASGANKSSAATSLFASFDEEPASSAADNSFDPFGSSGNNNSGFGSAPSDPFAAPQSTPPQKAPKKATPIAAAPAKKAAEPDLFGNFDAVVPPAAPATKSEDPFASSVSTNRPARRSSAQEIQLDFAGLSFAPEPPKKAEPVIVAPAPEPEPAPVETPKIVDPWDAAKNLVNLDLGGRNTKPVQRQSVSSGPTLDAMMGVQSQRRTSMNSAVPIDPFAIPAGGPSGLNSFGGPVAPAAPAAPVYGRGLAGGPTPQPPAFQPMGGGGFGGPMGGGPQNVRGSIGGAPGGYGGGMSQYPYQPPGGQQKPPQSSLDTLSWN